ncbi:MAG: hypothetical protein ACRESX_11480, partial [Gammaproteobacteria bacterium]
MLFSWLPDAKLDPHPRRTWLVECCFDLAVLALYRREVIWPPGFRLAPGTLIVSNHQRDADVPILATTLCQREGVYLRQPLPFFAAREDLFRRGFLAEYATGWSRYLRPLLGTISLAWMFRIARCEPMRRLREFTLAETLNILSETGFAQADPVTVFNARGRREITAALGRLPPHVREISPYRLGPLRLSYWGLRRLRVATYRAVKPSFHATITAQLQRFASVLDSGRSLYFAPEGVISTTGRFGHIRAGARQVCRLTAAPPQVLPVALSYDALGPGRLRVIINVGELVHAPDPSSQESFAAGLRNAILKLYVVTPSHLIAKFLVVGPAQFTTQAFAAWLHRATETITPTGFMLDPLFSRRAAENLAGERLCWLTRKGLIAREAAGWRNCWPRDTAPGWQKPVAVVRYLATALDDLSPELARTLCP